MKILRLGFIAGLLAMVAVAALVSAGGQPGTAPRDSSEVFHGPGEPQLAVIDTDIGDDIDDAFALALALRSPELKLLGVTTAYGDTELRARLVDRYLEIGRAHV